MSENEIEATPATDQEIEDSPVEEVVEKKSGFPFLPIVIIISLILAIAAAAGSGFGWYENQQQQLQQSQSIQSLNNKLQSLQQAQQLHKDSTAVTQATLNKQQQEISQQLEQITEKLGRNRYDWAVAEIRYTLRQANMRLQLFNDKTTALVALQLADAQLAKLADPALYKLRGTLNKEITALQAVKEIDIEGISLKLSALADQVDKLEVSITGRSKESDAAKPPLLSSANELADWQKHADSIWSELKTLVSIRRTDKKILPLLSEQESQQLRQALGLKIEITRLALLQKNTSLFHASLQAANDWLEEYFNADQPAVVAITKELKALMSLQLEPDYPDISRSLAMLEQSQAASVDKKPAKAEKSEKKKAPVTKEKQAQ